MHPIYFKNCQGLLIQWIFHCARLHYLVDLVHLGFRAWDVLPWSVIMCSLGTMTFRQKFMMHALYSYNRMKDMQVSGIVYMLWDGRKALTRRGLQLLYILLTIKIRKQALLRQVLLGSYSIHVKIHKKQLM